MRFLEAALVALMVLASGALAQPVDWSALQSESVIEVLTSDGDGSLRETPVWIVVLDGAAYVRTNDSKWLANIRRGSAVALRLDGTERPVTSEEVSDAAVTGAVEEAFKAKYGLMQRMMSALRMREPTVLRLSEASP